MVSEWSENVSAAERKIDVALLRNIVEDSQASYRSPCLSRNLCVSLFMPTPTKPSGVRQVRTCLQSLLSEAEQQLLASGMWTEEARQLLEPAKKLRSETQFWRGQGDGLAVFLSGEVFCCFRVPFTLAPLVVATHRFHLKPILPLLSADRDFYVLALTSKRLILRRGTPFGFVESDVTPVPDALARVLGSHQAEAHPRSDATSGTPVNKRVPSSASHGHRAGAGGPGREILRYFQLVDCGLQELVCRQTAPLVVAGKDRLRALYRRASSYAHLADEAIRPDPKDLSARQLHELAWAIVKPILVADREAAAARCGALLGCGSHRASRDVREIVPAAYGGRVKTLFVAAGVQQWGYYDSCVDAVRLHEEVEPGDEDVLDFAAVHTLSNEGTVHLVEAESIPGGAAAAVFR